MLSERFWSKIRKTDTCWVWTGTVNWFGYGLWHPTKGRQFRAHRLVYEALVGPIPPGKFVCHHCDNPPCVRPDHLFVGTHTDNVRDMIAKGRRPPSHWLGQNQKGEANRYAKLTDNDVREIRLQLAKGERQKDIAARFGVHVANISHISRGKTWTHVG